MPIASLPMYDLPEAAAHIDAWWRGLAAAMRKTGLGDVPEHLERGANHTAAWASPDLLFSQTCGYPLTHAYRGRLSLVATPIYTAPGCRGSEYCSFVMVRRDDRAIQIADLKGKVAAINSEDSQSGYSALRAAVAPESGGSAFFRKVLISGSHAKSLELVATGKADVCAIDCVTHAVLARYRSAATDPLRPLSKTPPAPALPFVTHPNTPAKTIERLRAALFEALEDPDLAEARSALFLDGAEVLPLSAYDRILEMEREAEGQGYPAVA
jgi:ABC-type phosphate/phosphonate transport system substrate-binding protein